MWKLFLKLIDGEYEIVQGGYNLVPTQIYDKTLPTTEKIARQFEKVYFDGDKLQVVEGETLLSIEELNQELKVPESNEINEIEIFDIE
ncbi:hypothetical protein [Staphylococcus devriesei]|uniref:hypothetical protein n=1 Tax=Staphylococcus devriesei TaxID=586733 RepID=UPI001F48F092|nr:hypothetical protein [Staphylococcus devriesei]MCE5089235.1 hypothetical protein [Staphylococcus devriesei]